MTDIYVLINDKDYIKLLLYFRLCLCHQTHLRVLTYYVPITTYIPLNEVIYCTKMEHQEHFWVHMQKTLKSELWCQVSNQ